jgi:hypothetical protein
MHDRCSQETRNKQTHTPHHPRKGSPRAVVLLPQDPTVCQTLNRTPRPPTVPGTPQERNRTGQGESTCGRYLLIFHP